jgi:Protein of unknown function (DUF2505)
VKVRHESLLPLSAADAFEMNLDPSYQEAKCAAGGAAGAHVSVQRSGDTAVVVTRRTMLPAGFPALIRRFVPSGLTTTETVRWGEADARGGRVGRLEVDIHPAPATMTGTLTITPEGVASARVVLDADFSATVPVIGRTLEHLAGPIIRSTIRAEEETGDHWAADRAAGKR